MNAIPNIFNNDVVTYDIIGGDIEINSIIFVVANGVVYDGIVTVGRQVDASRSTVVNGIIRDDVSAGRQIDANASLVVDCIIINGIIDTKRRQVETISVVANSIMGKDVVT